MKTGYTGNVLMKHIRPTVLCRARWSGRSRGWWDM